MNYCLDSSQKEFPKLSLEKNCVQQDVNNSVKKKKGN